MIILNATLANEMLVNGALNPKFFGVVATSLPERIITVTPPPVMVYPPDQIVEGIVVQFPPYTSQPPPQDVKIPATTGEIKNAFESVGIINPGGQIRLCALVRPNVIAAAHHYNNAPFAPYIGLAVAFGTETARITKIALTRDDFECYYLDRSITSVKPAVVATLQGAETYAAREVIVFGLGNLTRPIAGKTLLKYAFPNGTTWVATASNKATQPLSVQAGDSGSPVFITVDGVTQYFGSLASVNLTEIKVNMAPPHKAQIESL